MNTESVHIFSNTMYVYKSISPTLYGGLGNQLFQLAAAVSIAKKLNRKICIDTFKNNSLHSNLSYFETIFKMYKKYYSVVPSVSVNEDSWKKYTYLDHIKLHGYFQDWRYIPDSFCSTLVFSNECLSRYPTINKTVFLHIRGGDYINHPDHDIHLDSYYEKAIQMFPVETQFSIFTNDMEYAKSKPYLQSISHSFVNENEVDSLFLMSQCCGGICANSSFSWWGAYLNTNRRLLFPNKWTTDPSHSISRYQFPNSIFLEY